MGGGESVPDSKDDLPAAEYAHIFFGDHTWGNISGPSNDKRRLVSSAPSGAILGLANSSL